MQAAYAQERSTRFYYYELQGEGYLNGELDSVYIYDRMPTASERREGVRRLEKYTRLRYNVHRVYPYAVKVAEVLREVDAVLLTLPDESSRKAYLKEREKALFGAYEDDIRNMTRSQGLVLVKLVHRETEHSMYDLIRDTKSGAAAFFWQTVGSIFGINLKTHYDPEEDAMIEDIVRELEYGGFNIAYQQYNYMLQ
ncbi:MAG: DUF4294 domain-containing protein [Bacteroidia bacterium]|nr:DUF4294 domain-containing protein [Bacteroidia bacterium]